MFTGHLAKLGRTSDSVEAFNSAVGSLERQVLPGARKFTELGVRPDRELEVARSGRQAGARAAVERGLRFVCGRAGARAAPTLPSPARRGRIKEGVWPALDDSHVNRAAPPGSMRYFSLLYAPEDRRDQLLALYVIDAEIRESAQSVNHDVAHTRLQWWRAEIDRLANGSPQHPATRLLNDSSVERASFAKLHEIMVAADMDLARMTYSNMRRSCALTHPAAAARSRR